jgi:hypothetical protein
MLGAVLLHCAPAASAPPAPPTKKAAMSKYDDAVRLLASPKTWCEGAKQLVQQKDPRAILPILHAFDQPVEAETLCLFEAMEALGAEAAGPKLLASKLPDERVAGLRLMVIFTSNHHLPLLRDVALNDPDPAMRERALDALRRQEQTTAWEDTIATFLALPDEQLRGWAIDRLIEHNGESTWRRVRAHVAHEVSPALRARIEAALKAHRPG